MPDTSAITVVGRTALAVALSRASESERPDRWFDDPIARQFALEVRDSGFTHELEPVLISEALTAWIAVRTRFLDELVTSAFTAGTRQLVIVGAGLDARAFRLPLPEGSAVWEIDREDVLGVKDRVLADAGLVAAAARTVVTTDVMDEDWLAGVRDAGWNPEQPTVWLMEGFLIYFEDAVRRRLLRQLHDASAPGSVLGATVSTQIDNSRHSLWQAFADGDFAGWFAESGWDANVDSMIGAAERFGRPLAAEDRDRVAGALVQAVPLAG